MAQGFKRTGNAFSLKKSSAPSGGSGSTKIRKGARIIAPKKDAARAKANLTHKLTAQLNRRAESALITRMGGNREGSLKLVRPDAQIVEEIKAKKARKDIGRNSETEGKAAAATAVAALTGETINSLSKSALDHINGEFDNEIEEDDEEFNDEESK